MVRFRAITILQEQDSLGFDCLDLFNEFRRELWDTHLQGRYLNDTFKWQQELERDFETLTCSRPGTMAGIYLVMGNEREVDNLVDNQLAVSLFRRWDTEIDLTIDMKQEKVKVTAYGYGMEFVKYYSTQYLLFPSQANLSEAYSKVAIRKQLGLPEPNRYPK